MKVLLTDEEVAQIISKYYGVNANDIEWIDEDGNYSGFTINAKGITILE